MKRGWLEVMSDREVVERLVELLREERRLTATVLVHLGEVEARRLFLPAACSSMHGYCVRVLGMSEDQAFKRIRAARAVRRFPVIGEAVAQGRLHLSGVVLLAPHLNEENAERLVAEASGKSKAEIELLLARRAPRPDVPERLERVAEQTVLVVPGPVDEVVPGPVAHRVAPGPVAHRVAPGPVDEVVTGPVDHVVPGPARVVAKVAPLSAERFALQMTINGETRDKLLRAQALLRHQVPSGDLAEVLDRALDALLEKAEARKFGQVKKPRAAKASGDRRYVPRAARRQAVARDGARCSFVGEDGRRCEETGFLELDHVVPVAQGDEASDGARILCRSHDQYEAERILGREVVEAGRAAKARLFASRRGRAASRPAESCAGRSRPRPGWQRGARAARRPGGGARRVAGPRGERAGERLPRGSGSG